MHLNVNTDCVLKNQTQVSLNLKIPRYHHLDNNAINTAVDILFLFIRIQSDERPFLVELIQLEIPLYFLRILILVVLFMDVQKWIIFRPWEDIF